MRPVSLATLRSQLLSLPILAKSKSRARLNLLAIRPCVVKRHGSLTGRSNCEVERFAECEVRTASFAYESKVVSNSLDKREDHFTGFRVVKRFVGDILNARCLSDLPPFFAHGIIRHFLCSGLRLRTAEPVK